MKFIRISPKYFSYFSTLYASDLAFCHSERSPVQPSTDSIRDALEPGENSLITGRFLVIKPAPISQKKDYFSTGPHVQAHSQAEERERGAQGSCGGQPQRQDKSASSPSHQQSSL